MLAPGLHTVPRKQYDLIERVNLSTLKYMALSPAHYHHALVEPREDTDELRIGRGCHTAVFEPERFHSTFVRWDGGVRRGKEWDAFSSEFRDRDILRDEDYELCLTLSRAVRSDLTASKYLTGGRGETTIIWSDDGVDCKGRVDFIANVGALCDLKTTTDASPVGFGRQCARLGYHVAAAWYQDAYAAATGQQLPFRFVAVEKRPPYVVQVYRVPDRLLELGRDTYRAWLERLRECRAESSWPGYAVGEIELELPAWAAPEDAGALGLTGLDEESTDA
jgi:hypothetical protein